ncbi:tyrosine-protein phosphatase non-receptor type substrate 1-like [Heptranchias perlo]|uniref:tyrosine-protein phosphatase non-receptor type substrate 1-like n=1 Tax=Heptranchias perlo TaxID=212740 RepID=UPI003559BCAE
MSASMVFLCLTLRGIIYTAADHSSFRVTQAPEQAIVSKGGDITFYCIFPISQTHSWVRVYWWKQGEDEYLPRSADKRKRFGLEGKARGFFQLMRATFQDSGVYHCAVIREGIVGGNGTGSHLIVHAPPTPLKIVSRTAEGNSSATLTLVCETAEFYPENFTLAWYKNGVVIATGINTIKRQNTEGLYEVSSSLEETQYVPSGTNYTCVISHVSLKTPAIVTYSVTKSNQAGVIDVSFYFWVPICAVAGLVFLVLMVFIGRRCGLQNNEGKQERVMGPTRREELGAEAEIVHYVALDLSKDMKIPRRKGEEQRTVYAQKHKGQPVTS